MSGTLGLSSPWARQAIPYTERMELQALIPDGWTIGVYVNSNNTAYGIRVVKWGETPAGNRVVWGGDEERHYYRDVRAGIADALAWIEWQRVAA